MLSRLVPFVLLCMTTTSLLAQQRTLEGVVADQESGEALIGVAILLQGTTKGTTTGLDGSFRLAVGDQESVTLLFTYLGYETRSEQYDLSDGGDIGTVDLVPDAVNLQEVEVFASMTRDRITPVAASSISYQEIETRFQGEALPQMLNSTPGLFVTPGAGGFGDDEVYVRGFPQNETAFLVNGIPVNDMENGRMFWSNFAGLNEVTRNMEVQRGLGASKLALNSLGGTVNMITKPADKNPGGRIEYALSNGTWDERVSLSLHTGQMANGWAVSFQGSRTTAEEGIRRGSFVDAWSYYLGVNKRFNSSHTMLLTVFGAPVNRGTGWLTTEENYDLFQDNYYNWAYGITTSGEFNARQNFSHKPVMSLSHYWDVTDRLDITSSVYFSFSDVYSTQPREIFQGGEFNGPSVTLSNGEVFNLEGEGVQNYGPDDYPRTAEGYIDWTLVEEMNRANVVTIQNPNGDPNATPFTGKQAMAYVEARHNDHVWYGALSTATYRVRPNITLVGGIDLRDYRARHYVTVFDLMGADFVADEFAGVPNNLLRPHAVATLGDRINYDYDGYVKWQALFGQVEWGATEKLDIFTTLTLSRTTFTRVGNFWNGSQPFNSLGEGENLNLNNYNLRFGGNYRFNGRHSLYANGGYFTRAPYLGTVFEDPRYQNGFLEGVGSETVYATELGYRYRSPYLSLNVNAYSTTWRDRTFGTQLVTQDEFDRFAAVTGVDARHMGIEIDGRGKPFSSLEISGFISLGDWNWLNDVTGTVSAPGGEVSEPIDVRIADLPVGNAAQTTAQIGAHYTGIRDMYMGFRLNHFDRVYTRYSPENVAAGFVTPDQIRRLDDFRTLDVYLGRYLDIGDDLRGRFAISASNLLNTEFVSYLSVFSNEEQPGYGYPRRLFMSFSLTF